MASPVSQWIEEDYFVSICAALAAVGCDEEGIEENAHRIMDAWTFDGILDTDSLDKIMETWG